ncbi:MAG: 3-keto-5-aminohexanoate cleavage protein [Chloroflexi bacterium]|nr:3-keto-5-aminohexanoate cleavage protein [Chloroflexota bacterium]
MPDCRWPSASPLCRNSNRRSLRSAWAQQHHVAPHRANPLDDAAKDFHFRCRLAALIPRVEVNDSRARPPTFNRLLNNVTILREQGWLADPLWINFVMGIPGQVMTTTPKNLLHLAESSPPNVLWLVSAIGGRAHWAMAAMAMAMGGHVRTGLEDNVYLERGVLAGGNAPMVEKMIRLAREIGREIATPDEARETLNLRRNGHN